MSVEEGGTLPVYDLTVDGEPEFFASGILVHNSRVFHVGKRGDLAKLEEEQTTWVPGQGDSPNRVDALVHGITELAKRGMPGSIASPKDLGLPPSSPFGAQRHLRII